jgi:hypothetical protein
MAASSTPNITSVVDQLEFGDKTESKDAVSLPIKLAVALLKDRNGVIDLNIPVNGTLDDPKFRSGAPHLEGLRQHSRESGHRTLCFARLPVRRGTGFAVHRFLAGSVGRLDPAAVRQAPAVIVKALE